MKKQPPIQRGRPQKNPEDRKGQTIAFRVEAADRQQFQEAADLAGMKLSDWIRDRLLEAARRARGDE